MTILTPATVPGRMLQNMRHALSLGLGEVEGCRRHAHALCVAGGGPSLADTYGEMKGYIAAINGSQKFLEDRGVTPDACGILDAGEHMPDVITANKSVRYYVASICDPGVFRKLHGCHVTLWHPSSVTGCQGTLELRGSPWITIAGGSTMGLRWMNLGYVLGFRKFHLHGLDSSFCDGQTHAYADRERNGPILEVEGRKTRANFLEQADEFFGQLERFEASDIEPIAIEMFGDGLLQDRWRKHQAKRAA